MFDQEKYLSDCFQKYGIGFPAELISAIDGELEIVRADIANSVLLKNRETGLGVYFSTLGLDNTLEIEITIDNKTISKVYKNSGGIEIIGDNFIAHSNPDNADFDVKYYTDDTCNQVYELVGRRDHRAKTFAEFHVKPNEIYPARNEHEVYSQIVKEILVPYINEKLAQKKKKI